MAAARGAVPPPALRSPTITPLSPGYVDLDLDQPSAASGCEANGATDETTDGFEQGYDSTLKPQLVGRAEPRGSSVPERLPTVRSMAETAEEMACQVQWARKVSIISLAASLLAAGLGLGIGVCEEVLSLVGFGLESLLDSISSALVLWRFKPGKPRQHANLDAALRHQMLRDARRERNSAIGIGATFLASAVLLAVSAVLKLLAWDPNEPEHIDLEKSGAYYSCFLSWPSAFVFGGLAVAKFRLAHELRSKVLEKDALCSVLGAVLALICAIAAVVELASSDNPVGMELVDTSASGLIAALLGVEGLRTLWHNLPSAGAWAHQHQPMA